MKVRILVFKILLVGQDSSIWLLGYFECCTNGVAVDFVHFDCKKYAYIFGKPYIS